MMALLLSARPEKVFSFKVKVALNLVNGLTDISGGCYCKCTSSD